MTDLFILFPLVFTRTFSVIIKFGDPELFRSRQQGFTSHLEIQGTLEHFRYRNSSACCRE